MVVLIIALIAGVFGVRNYQDAQTNLQVANTNLHIARSQALAGDANLALTSNAPDLALLLGVVATREHESYETRNTLMSALQAENTVVTILRDPKVIPGQVSPDQALQSKYFLLGGNSAATSRDGTTLASFSATQHITVWNRSDAHTPRAILDASAYHKRAIFTLALSLDGKYLASTGYDGAWLWNTKTGQLVQTIDKGDLYYAAAFNSDGTQLAAARCVSQCVIQIWDVAANGTLSAVPRTLPTQGDIYSLDFSPDGHWLASSGCVFPDCENGTQLWNLTTMTAEPLASVDPIVGGGVAFSPDGKWLASSGCVHNCDGLATMVWPMTASGPGAAYDYPNVAGALGFSQQSGYSTTLLVSGCGNSADFSYRPVCADTTLDYVNVQTHHVDVYPQNVTGYVTRLAVAADTGEITLGISNGDIILVNTNQLDHTASTLTDTVPQNGSLPTYVLLSTVGAFSSQGTLALAGGGTIKTWNAASGGKSSSSITLIDTVQSSLAYSPDGKTLAVGSGTQGNISLLDASGGTKATLTSGLNGPVLSTAFSSDGKTLAASVCNNDACQGLQVFRWDLTQANPKPQQLQIPAGVVPQSMAYDPAQPVLAMGGYDGKVTLWNARNNTTTNLHQAQLGPILGLAFSPDGSTLATVVLFKDITVQPLTFVQYWDVATGAPLASGFDYGDTIAAAAFSNDGKRFLIASAQGSAGTILRYDYGLAAWQYRACAVANRGFSPDEMLLYQLDKKYRNVCATVAAPK